MTKMTKKSKMRGVGPGDNIKGQQIFLPVRSFVPVAKTRANVQNVTFLPSLCFLLLDKSCRRDPILNGHGPVRIVVVGLEQGRKSPFARDHDDAFATRRRHRLYSVSSEADVVPMRDSRHQQRPRKSHSGHRLLRRRGRCRHGEERGRIPQNGKSRASPRPSGWKHVRHDPIVPELYFMNSMGKHVFFSGWMSMSFFYCWKPKDFAPSTLGISEGA